MRRAFKIIIGIALLGAAVLAADEASFRLKAARTPENVIYRISGEAVSAKYYDNIEELANDSSYVVLAECRGSKAFKKSSFDWTRCDFHVEKVFKGDITPGEDIKVVMMGRNISARDYKKKYGSLPYDFENEVGGDYKDTDLISMVYNYDRIPLKGDRAILFLNESGIFEGEYERTGGGQGALYEDKAR